MSTAQEDRFAAWAAARSDVRAVRVCTAGVEIHYTDGRVLLASRSPDDSSWVDVRTPGQPTLRSGPRAPRSAFGAFGGAGPERARAPGDMRAPSAGTLVRLLVQEGDRVEAGQLLGVIELMKMEIELRADVSGRVRDCRVSAGQSVARDAALLRIDPAD